MVDILLLEYSIDAYKKVLVKRVRVHPCWVTADYYIANLTTYRLCHPYAYIDTQICPIVLTVFPEQPHSYGHCSRWHLFGPLEGTLAYSHNGRVTLIQFSMWIYPEVPPIWFGAIPLWTDHQGSSWCLPWHFRSYRQLVSRRLWYAIEWCFFFSVDSGNFVFCKRLHYRRKDSWALQVVQKHAKFVP